MAETDVLKLDDNYIIVVAIEIGTTFSCGAFSFKDKKTTICMNRNWGAVRGFDSYETPTSVMTNPDGSLHSFGYDAEDNYFQLDPDSNVGGGDGYNLYRNLKMVLHGKDVNMNSTIASISGHITKAIDIWTMALKFLKNHTMEPINKAVTHRCTDNAIRWVITVPATGADNAKDFIRQAAFQAGLIPSVDANTLLIALEPEAVTVFCASYLEVSSFATSEASSENISFRTGDKMMIIDAGKGTVNITAHCLEKDRKVKEITRPSGGPWGGMEVDAKFVHMLEKVLGIEFIRHIQKKSPQQWLNFMTTIERSRKSVKQDGKSAIKVSVPYEFYREYQILTHTDIESTIKNHPEKLISFVNGQIVVMPDQVKELFEDTCTQIKSHISKLLENLLLKELDYMLLIGEYGESSFLKEACDKAFGSVCKFLVPCDAQHAIVKGAVLFGHKWFEISSRVSRLTYGCEAFLLFKEGVHDPRRSYISKRDGQKRCRNTFVEFVRKGEEMKNPDIRSFTVHPPTKKEKQITIILYKSEKPEVIYVNEDGVEKVGDFMLTSPKGYLSEDIELRVTFGYTEMIVEARDPKGGKEFPVRKKIELT